MVWKLELLFVMDCVCSQAFFHDADVCLFWLAEVGKVFLIDGILKNQNILDLIKAWAISKMDHGSVNDSKAKW
jgi:hypothetical protein